MLCEEAIANLLHVRGARNADGEVTQKVNTLALTEALDAMRELGSLHATLPLFASTGLVNTFKHLASHQVSSLEAT